jgi:hypothetical protein
VGKVQSILAFRIQKTSWNTRRFQSLKGGEKSRVTAEWMVCMSVAEGVLGCYGVDLRGGSDLNGVLPDDS